jgi:uncharacterized protein YbjT (DUF2867 family)
MIIVTGATGQLGSKILARLQERLPLSAFGATARDPGKAAELVRQGVKVHRADYREPDSLAAAFKGASQVLMVSSDAGATGGDTLGQHRIAIAAAKQAGVGRIVYTSQISAANNSLFPPGRMHAATEEMLAASGMKWTALRNGFYASTVPRSIGDALQSGEFSVPEDGKVAWTTHDDLAEAAARILLEEGRFEGPTPPLTAAESLDFTDIAALLTEIGGRPVARRVLTDGEHEQQLVQFGLPRPTVDIVLGMYRAARAGEFDKATTTLTGLIGRTPISLRYVLADLAAGGAATARTA